MLGVKHVQHRLLFDTHQGAIGECGRSRHAHTLYGKTVFAEEIVDTKDADGRFLASFRDHGQLDSARLNIKYGVARVPLGKDWASFLDRDNLPARPNLCEEHLWIKS